MLEAMDRVALCRKQSRKRSRISHEIILALVSVNVVGGHAIASSIEDSAG
jgi:hypothetical protein